MALDSWKHFNIDESKYYFFVLVRIWEKASDTLKRELNDVNVWTGLWQWILEDDKAPRN